MKKKDINIMMHNLYNIYVPTIYSEDIKMDFPISQLFMIFSLFHCQNFNSYQMEMRKIKYNKKYRNEKIKNNK